MHGVIGHSISTKQVSDLVNIIDGKSPAKDSLFEQASTFFLNYENDQAELAELTEEVDSLTQSIKRSRKKASDQVQSALKKAKHRLKRERDRQEQERAKRLDSVRTVCEKLIRVSEGESWEKTQVSSARFLGTVQLLCPNAGVNVRQIKQRFKPAYKAVISIRLLDKLLADKHIAQEYICSRYYPDTRYCSDKKELTSFHYDVVIPLIVAAIFQDIGLLHPKAQALLKGKDGRRDEYAVLDKEERLELLKLNHKHTLEYVMQGLGPDIYIGDSRLERTEFNAKQQQKMKFIRSLLVGALNPKEGIGNLIKVPQIYASFIFSAKPEQTLYDLPKAGLLIINAAKRASVSQVAVESMLKILGHFPQGYGVTYITVYPDGSFSDFFEYAIVVGLNPKNPYEPICRAATKNLTFVTNGQPLVISTKRNLYYPEPKKLLEKIKPARLQQILKKLVSNYEERKDLDLIPSYWDPHAFFQFEKMQNLWKNS